MLKYKLASVSMATLHCVALATGASRADRHVDDYRGGKRLGRWIPGLLRVLQDTLTTDNGSMTSSADGWCGRPGNL